MKNMNDSKLLTYVAKLFFLSVIAAVFWGIFIGALFMWAVGFILGILGTGVAVLVIYAYVNIAYILDKKIKDEPLSKEKISFLEKFVCTLSITVPAAFLGVMLFELVNSF